MPHFKILLITAALMTVPCSAFAQVPTDGAVDVVKEKAIDTVMDNMTTEDAVIAGSTMIQGGSKEDAAIAVVKNRAAAKIDGMTGSSTTYTDGVSKDGVMDAGKALAMEQARAKALEMSKKKAKMNGETWGMSADEKAKSMITSGQHSGEAHIIQKSGQMPAAASTVAVPLNCPAGTKDAGDGTCMITGDWKP